MGSTTTSRGGTSSLGDTTNICALPSTCGDGGDGGSTFKQVLEVSFPLDAE